MVLIPLLAFDKAGHRVGYGKGFYDRFLADCRPDVQKVGLSLELPIESITDPNPFDVPLDAVVMPDGIWRK
jgi:5-formyltetrahydrofolate cyclo-ligase